MADDMRAELLRERAHPLLQRFALEGQGELRACHPREHVSGSLGLGNLRKPAPAGLLRRLPRS